MEKTFLLNLLENHTNMIETDLEKLEEISVAYPYCQTTHILIAKYTNDTKSLLAPQKLRRAAAYTYKRNVLRDFLYNQLVFELEYHKILPIQSEKYHTEEEINQQQENREGKTNQITKQSEKNEEISFFDSFENEKQDENKISPTENITDKDLETNAFFENLDEYGHPLYEAINEGLAMGLYYDGNTISCIKMYKKLMLLYPSKKEYFKEQLLSLLGKKIYVYQNELADLDSLDENTDTVLKENLQENNISKIEIIQENITNITENNWIDELELQDFVNSSTEESTQVLQDYHQSIEFLPINQDFDDENNFENNEVENEVESQVENKTLLQNNEVIFDIKSEEKPLIETEQKNDNEIILNIKNEEKPEIETEQINENEVIFDIKKQEEKEISTEKAEVKFHILSEEETKEEVNTAFISPMTVIFEENKPKNEIEIVEKEENQEDKITSFFDTFNQTDVSFDTNSSKTITKIFPENIEKKEIKLEIVESEKIENWTESQAIFYFQEGKNQQSIQIYQKLAEEYPTKKEYFEKQIKAIGSQQTQDLREKIEVESIQFSPHTTNNDEYSEELALRLFAQGRVSESIFVYEKLTELYPQKNNYYLSQISIMTS